jgi:hypothetical protein
MGIKDMGDVDYIPGTWHSHGAAKFSLNPYIYEPGQRGPMEWSGGCGLLRIRYDGPTSSTVPGVILDSASCLQ